jgi:ABC-2 type transport system ATP-binding protein
VTTPAIEVVSLVRRFGALAAVDGIDFRVDEGEIFGFLGPNGAGKSTTIKILSTLLPPTAGQARIAGHDVVRDASVVRRALGLLFQDPTVDDRLTGRENLQLHCMIYAVPRAERRERIDEGLAWIGLGAHADEQVRSYSGGMRRRLEVARALLHRPRVLFLDEPTTGLDPQTRRTFWQQLHERRARDRLTIFVTTHYMDEAENCDRLAIIDHGRIIAEGTPAALRARAGRERIVLDTDDNAAAARALEARFGVAAQKSERGLELPVEGDNDFLSRMADFPVRVRRLALHAPTLEDAFIALTGHGIRPEEASSRDHIRRQVKMRRRT